MRFRLVRYFTLTSLVAFALVTAALAYFQRQIAIDNLLEQKEASNVEMTRAFSNSLWSEFAPFVAAAQGRSAEELQAAPEVPRLFDSVKHLMTGLSVIKIKVFDLDGVTAFSTEFKQIGQDKSTNAGFVSARNGVPKSELTHRDTFSAFESVIEDRDVISSYTPIRDVGSGEVVGVFEVYTDVTPLLAKIDRTSALVVAGVVGLLLLLFLALFVIVRRADRIIAEQARERERTQQRVVQSEKMATLGQMVAGVAHQLNTPLAFTSSNVSLAKEVIEAGAPTFTLGAELVELIKAHPGDRLRLAVDGVRESIADQQVDPDTPQQLAEMLSLTLGGLEQMRDLVINLREFTRIDRARQASYDLNKGLDNVLYIAHSVIPDRISVRRDYDAQVPAIHCLPSQLNQVFMNLINNAAQAISGAGSITVRTAREGSDRVCVEVSDTGVGIPAEVLPHIFEPFFTTKTTEDGNGIGLSIAREIVEGHGGTLSVETVEGAGSTFRVVLPIGGAEDAALDKAA